MAQTCADPEYLVRYYRGERDPARTPHATRAEAGVPHEDVPARPAQGAAQTAAIEQPVGGQPEPAPAINTLEALATSTGEVFPLRPSRRSRCFVLSLPAFP